MRWFWSSHPITGITRETDEPEPEPKDYTEQINTLQAVIAAGQAAPDSGAGILPSIVYARGVRQLPSEIAAVREAIYEALGGDPTRWTNNPDYAFQWAQLAAWIKGTYPNLQENVRFKARVDALVDDYLYGGSGAFGAGWVAPRAPGERTIPTAFGGVAPQPPTAANLWAWPQFHIAMNAINSGWDLMPAVFGVQTELAAPQPGEGTAPTGTETAGFVPGYSETGTFIPPEPQPQPEGEAEGPVGMPQPGAYQAVLPQAPTAQVTTTTTYFYNGLYGPQAVTEGMALLYAQIASPVKVGAVIPARPMTWTPGQYGAAIGSPPGMEAYYRQMAAPPSPLPYRMGAPLVQATPLGPESVINWPTFSQGLGPAAVNIDPYEYLLTHRPSGISPLAKLEQVDEDNYRFYMPESALTAAFTYEGTGVKVQIPVFQAGEVEQMLQMLQPTSRGGGGYGSTSTITYDREEVKQYIEQLWRAYLLEDLPEEEAYRMADSFIEEAVAFHGQGGTLDLEAWTVKDIQATPRHRLIYHHKPPDVEDLDFIGRFQSMASQIGVPERLWGPEIVRSTASGASAEGFGTRMLRGPSMWYTGASGTFISRMAQNAANSIASMG